ncbi:flavin reductase family protein [Streptacidiphilus sp. PAMC 29251]
MDLIPTPAEPAALRAAFACIPQGVTALCALDESGTPRGITASSLTTVSLDPPLISVAMAHTSTTWPRLRHLPRLGVSVLADDQNETCRALAARTQDRFADIDWHATDHGAVLLGDAVLWMDCTIEDAMPAGDHQIVLLRIHALSAQPDREPLVFHASRFRRLQPC